MVTKNCCKRSFPTGFIVVFLSSQVNGVKNYDKTCWKASFAAIFVWPPYQWTPQTTQWDRSWSLKTQICNNDCRNSMLSKM